MTTDEAQRARQTALDLLARREHTATELGAKLTTRGYPAELVASVLAALSAEGLLSESRFAEAFVAARSRRGMGPLRLRAELRQRGVADEIIDAALAAPELDWKAIARRVRRKKFGDDPPADLRDRARQIRFLEYRGFDSDLIRAVLGR